MQKKTIKVLSFLSMLLLAACSDDSGNNASLQNDSNELPKREVSSIYELGVCDETNALTSTFVAKENALYFCDGTRWQKTYFESSSSLNQAPQTDNPGYQQSSLLERYSSSSFIVDSSSRVSSSREMIESSSSTTIRSSSSKNLNSGTFIDSRDGKTYKTVVIGTQTWMAENLSYKIENSFCYENNEDNCNKYGRLYTLESAIYVCPNGWHLPTMIEWQTLCSLDGTSVAGKNLKTKTGWNKNGGADSYGFSALPAGHGLISTKGSLGYGGIGSEANFWVIPEMEDYFIELKGGDDAAYKTFVADSNGMTHIRSVRCLKGKNTYKSVSSSSRKSSSSQKIVSSSSVGSQLVDGILTDSRDCQKYKTVKIGTQTWMAQNLNYESRNSRVGRQYAYSARYYKSFGRFYTWSEATMACPSGWHLPSKDEWTTLFTAVGGKSTAGKKLKSESYWPNGREGSDAFDFSAFPLGMVDSNDFTYFLVNLEVGQVVGDIGRAYFWTSTEFDSDNAVLVLLMASSDEAFLETDVKNNGFNVRCLLD